MIEATLVLRHNTVGNFEVERPDNSVIGAVWCRSEKKWIFHPYDIQPGRTDNERRQIEDILDNLNEAGISAQQHRKMLRHDDVAPKIGPLSHDGIEGLSEIIN